MDDRDAVYFGVGHHVHRMELVGPTGKAPRMASRLLHRRDVLLRFGPSSHRLGEHPGIPQRVFNELDGRVHSIVWSMDFSQVPQQVDGTRDRVGRSWGGDPNGTCGSNSERIWIGTRRVGSLDARRYADDYGLGIFCIPGFVFGSLRQEDRLGGRHAEHVFDRFGFGLDHGGFDFGDIAQSADWGGGHDVFRLGAAIDASGFFDLAVCFGNSLLAPCIRLDEQIPALDYGRTSGGDLQFGASFCIDLGTFSAGHALVSLWDRVRK